MIKCEYNNFKNKSINVRFLLTYGTKILINLISSVKRDHFVMFSSQRCYLRHSNIFSGNIFRKSVSYYSFIDVKA